MIDRSPLLNGMSVKERAKHYDSLAAGDRSEPEVLKKRDRSYAGMPLSRQSAEHKAPTMTARGRKYEAPKKKKEEPGVAKRAGKYEAPKKKKEEPGVAKRAGKYEAPKKKSEEPGVAKRAGKYEAPKKKSEESGLAKRGKSYYRTEDEKVNLYALNYQFKLEINGYKIPCMRISNLSIACDTENVAEGGNNEFPNIFESNAKKAETLVIERALLADQVLNGFEPGVHVSGGTITIMRNRQPYREIYFDQGIITKCEYSNLDALGRDVMLHKIEIMHSGLY